jgi:hypothetical protein
MATKFQRVKYADLNARQQEQYNFQRISAVLADYGFRTINLGDDWRGADFLAYHIDGDTFFKVQLKGRLSFDKKYEGKDLWICFRDGDRYYLYPHDECLKVILRETNVRKTRSWSKAGIYNWPRLSLPLRKIPTAYELQA